MKTPWWLHLLIGVVIVTAGLAGWCHWMIRTRDNPVVILHRHLWISEPAWLDDHEHQAMWNELISLSGRVKARAEVVDATAELCKATQNHTTKWGLYANELYNRLEVLEKRMKQHRHCGE